MNIFPECKSLLKLYTYRKIDIFGNFESFATFNYFIESFDKIKTKVNIEIDNDVQWLLDNLETTPIELSDKQSYCRINIAKNVIAQKTRRGIGNRLIGNKKTLADIHYNCLVNGLSPNFFGLLGGISVFETSKLPDNKMILYYQGTTEIDTIGIRQGAEVALHENYKDYGVILDVNFS